MLFFYRDMHEGLVGWIKVQGPSFPCRKSICTSDRCVEQVFSQSFIGGGNKENKDCVWLYYPPRVGGAVWISVFHNNKTFNKNSWDSHYQFSINNSTLK